MEPIEHIKFSRNLVPNATANAFFATEEGYLDARVQGPVGIHCMLSHQDPQVVMDRNVDVQAAGDSNTMWLA